MFKIKTKLTTILLFIKLILICSSANAQINNLSSAPNSCLNVVIVNDFAYAACGTKIEVANLITSERSILNVAADDITADINEGLLFTQSNRNITMLSLANPFIPSVVTTQNTNFSFFSGISASSGVLVISGGARGSNTQVYTYNKTSLTLRTDGIPGIDSATGNPDVHLANSSNGVTAYYSQDIGSVANFAIQAVSLNTQGMVTNIASDTVLTTGSFNFGLNLGPSNFPVESEFLNGHLYVAHFAAQGLEVVNTSNNNQLENVIPLPFVPTNVATDGELLFVVGSANDSVVIINPSTREIEDALGSSNELSRPTGVAASTSHIVVADRSNGLLLFNRIPQIEKKPELSFLPTILLILEGDQ